MIYKQFGDIKLSALGMGTMRFPLKSEKNSDIDEEKTAEMVDYAIKHGVNYFDTAWGYHEGQSELVIGKILSRYPRESYYLASKFPGFDMNNVKNAAHIFEKQLEKCRVEYFDFYLCHSVTKDNADYYLDRSTGVFDYLLEQKRAGRIKHLGFSAHADYETFSRFLEAFGNKIEFCQLQINYIDYLFQEADKKIELLNKYGIPVWVMEPVRGGKLAVVEEAYAEILKKLRPEESIPGWAFRFLQTLPEVTMILSGMSDFNQVKENIETFSEDKPLNKEELAAVLNIGQDMVSKRTLLCTACRYCIPYCPKGLEIPNLLKLYNAAAGKDSEEVKAVPADKLPDACIGCGSCEKVCPQQIKIPLAMKELAEKLK